MNYRRVASFTGWLWLITFVTSIPARLFFYAPVLDHEGTYVTGAGSAAQTLIAQPASAGTAGDLRHSCRRSASPPWPPGPSSPTTSQTRPRPPSCRGRRLRRSVRARRPGRPGHHRRVRHRQHPHHLTALTLTSLPVVGLGAALRSAAGTITTAVAVLLAPPILGALVSNEIIATVMDYLPAGLTTVLVGGAGERYGPEVAALLLGAWAVGALAVGIVTLYRRDPDHEEPRIWKGLGMKAFVYERYGPPETLRMAEVDTPAPGADEVLVKVLGASVNAADWHMLRGKPLFSRATLGLLRPKHKILGVDIAGRVEGVGGKVTRFKAGDEVYANLLDHGYGGFAEYVAVSVDVVSPKPANLSFEEAAAVPMAAVTALQGLRRHGELQAGQEVLINGATGGVGSFAVQIAKAYGAEVTAVTSTGNLDLVRSLGADHVLDYTTTDFARDGRRYDLILDTVGNRSVPDLRRALAEGGKAAVTGFTSVPRLLAVSLRGGKDVAQVQAHVTSEDLELLSALIEAGKVRPRVDRRYRFAEIPGAIAYLEQGRARAKVVVEIA